MKILVTRRTRVLTTFKPENLKIKWVDKCFTCENCGCQFQLKSGDEAQIFARVVECDAGELGLNDFTAYFVFCPEGCGVTVKIDTELFPDSNSYKHIPEELVLVGKDRKWQKRR